MIIDFKNIDSESLIAILEAVKGRMDYLNEDSITALFNSKMQKIIEDFKDETLKEILNNKELKLKLLEIVKGNSKDKNLKEILNDRNQSNTELSGTWDILQTPAPSVLPIKECIVTAEADPEHKSALQCLVIDLHGRIPSTLASSSLMRSSARHIWALMRTLGKHYGGPILERRQGYRGCSSIFQMMPGICFSTCRLLNGAQIPTGKNT